MNQAKFKHNFFNLSTDYKKLWRLVKNGNRIPAWVLNQKLSEETWDIVEVKFISENYMIGTRGVGYESISGDYDDFLRDCTYSDLHFIDPLANHI
jgi:hypothetical protein